MLWQRIKVRPSDPQRRVYLARRGSDVISDKMRCSQWRSAASGQGLVEFAVSASVLLVLLFGVMQLAIVLDAILAVTQYSYAGVRYASINGTTCGSSQASSCVSSVTTNVAASALISPCGTSGACTVSVCSNYAAGACGTTCSSSNAISTGCQISVTVSYDLSAGGKLKLPTLFGVRFFPVSSIQYSESMLAG